MGIISLLKANLRLILILGIIVISSSIAVGIKLTSNDQKIVSTAVQSHTSATTNTAAPSESPTTQETTVNTGTATNHSSNSNAPTYNQAPSIKPTIDCSAPLASVTNENTSNQQVYESDISTIQSYIKQDYSNGSLSAMMPSLNSAIDDYNSINNGAYGKLLNDYNKYLAYGCTVTLSLFSPTTLPYVTDANYSFWPNSHL